MHECSFCVVQLPPLDDLSLVFLELGDFLDPHALGLSYYQIITSNSGFFWIVKALFKNSDSCLNDCCETTSPVHACFKSRVAGGTRILTFQH